MTWHSAHVRIVWSKHKQALKQIFWLTIVQNSPFRALTCMQSQIKKNKKLLLLHIVNIGAHWSGFSFLSLSRSPSDVCVNRKLYKLQNYEINPPVNGFPKFTLSSSVSAVFTISIKSLTWGFMLTQCMRASVRISAFFTKATALPHLPPGWTTWPVGTVDIVDIGFSPTLPPFLIWLQAGRL